MADSQSRLNIFIIFGAGIAGALGVILMAVSAHWKPEPSLVSASQILVFHGSALLSLSALSMFNVFDGKTSSLAAPLMLIGVFLFASDLCLRVFFGFTPFHYAAPLGGILIILGWIFVSISAFFRLIR